MKKIKEAWEIEKDYVGYMAKCSIISGLINMPITFILGLTINLIRMAINIKD